MIDIICIPHISHVHLTFRVTMNATTFSSPMQGKRKSRLRKWIRNGLLILSLWVILFFFLFGPGRLFVPSLLTEYSSVTDNRNTVYYSGDQIIRALDVLWMASEAADSINRFWGDTSMRIFDREVTIFLCDSPDQYIHLTWCNQQVCALQGRVVPDPLRSKSQEDLFSGLIRGMSQVYFQRRYGCFSANFLIPAWFREGCAGAIQDIDRPAASLGKNLEADPTLVSLTDLRFPWSWQAMERMDEGKMEIRGQGQASSFIRYLVRRFGQEKIRTYANQTGWSLRPDSRFKEVFQEPVQTLEADWMAEFQAKGKFPANVTYTGISFSWLVLSSWAGRVLSILVILLSVFLALRAMIPTVFLRKLLRQKE